MANNLNSNTSTIVLKKFLDGFQCDSVLTKTVDTQLIAGQINPSTGSTVQLKRPHQFRSKRTPDGDISSFNRNDIISGTALAQTRDYITVDMEHSQLEEAIELNQIDEITSPASSQMASDLEVELGQYMNQNLALQLGTAGTAISKWSDVANTGAYLKSLGVPSGELFATMNPFATTGLADTQSGLASGDNRLVTTAWEEAQITRNFGGVKALMSNCLPSHTNGTTTGVITVSAQPTQTYVSVKDTYTQSIVLTGFGNSVTDAVLAGDVIEITGVNFVNLKSRETFTGATAPAQRFQAVITADANSDGSGNVTAIISAPIFEANGQYNNIDVAIESADAVTFISGGAGVKVNPSLFYHKQAIGLGFIKLPKLGNENSKIITDPKSGISIRMTWGSELLENKNIVRFDMLPAFATFNPLFGGRFYGA